MISGLAAHLHGIAVSHGTKLPETIDKLLVEQLGRQNSRKCHVVRFAQSLSMVELRHKRPNGGRLKPARPPNGLRAQQFTNIRLRPLIEKTAVNRGSVRSLSPMSDAVG